MSRTPTTTDTTVEWEEKVTDPDSDSLTITLVLDAVDDGSGFTNDGTDSSNLSWLSFSKNKSTLADGTTEVLVNIVADKSGLNQGYSYRFRITANDGTTAVDRTFTLSIEEPPAYDGTKMYVSYRGDGNVYEYNLSTAWDTKTISELQSYNASNDIEVYPGAQYFRKDGKKFYLTDDDFNNNTIYEFDVATAWDITTLSKKQQASPSGARFRGIHWKEDGTKLVLLDKDGILSSFEAGTDWDISTLQNRTDNSNLSSGRTNGLFIKSDGSRLWILDDDTGKIVQYDLGTNWDISSITNTGSKDVSFGSLIGVFFRPNGEEFFVTNTDEYIDEFSLSTAWDISGGINNINQYQFNSNTNSSGLSFGK